MKEKIQEIKEKIIEWIIQQKILSAVILVTFIMLIAIIALPATQQNEKQKQLSLSIAKNQTSTTQTSTNNTNPTLSTSTSNQTPTLTTNNSITAKTKNPATQNQPISPLPNTTIPTPTQIIVTNQSSNQSSSRNKNATPQATSKPPTPTIAAPNTNPTSVPSNGPKIVFIDSNGQQQTYIPPATPPVQIIWSRYTNNLEHYAIDYPINWQIVKTNYAGHEAVFIYAPGADPGNPNVQYISFGWSTYYYPPAASYVGSFTQNGIPGTIYTNGSLGSSYIAGVFQYYNGFLVLNNKISDEIFAYIFSHMILSLDFNTP